MVQDLKSNHKAQIAELEISQDKEVENRINEHRNYLESAQKKFEAQKAKLEV